jgi:hypothetical protein
MKIFYQSCQVPCSKSIPQVVEIARNQENIILIACNGAAIEDLCSDELLYTGPEPQDLLFKIPALSNSHASQKLERVRKLL